MEAIINFQGKIPAQDLKIYTLEVTDESNGRVQKIDGGIISDIARHCGAPVLKLAGVDLKKIPGDFVVQDEPLYLIQSPNLEKLQEAHQKALRNSGFIIASLTT
jgi:thymidine phosphorylase